MNNYKTFEGACWFRPIHYAVGYPVTLIDRNAQPIRLYPGLCDWCCLSWAKCCLVLIAEMFISIPQHYIDNTSMQSFCITCLRTERLGYRTWHKFTLKYQAKVAQLCYCCFKEFCERLRFPSLFLFWCICSATCDHGWSHSFVPRSWEIWALWNLAISSE